MEEVQDSRQISKGRALLLLQPDFRLGSFGEAFERRQQPVGSGPGWQGDVVIVDMIPLWNRGLTSLATANRAGGAHGFSAMMS